MCWSRPGTLVRSMIDMALSQLSSRQYTLVTIQQHNTLGIVSLKDSALPWIRRASRFRKILTLSRLIFGSVHAICPNFWRPCTTSLPRPARGAKPRGEPMLLTVSPENLAFFQTVSFNLSKSFSTISSFLAANSSISIGPKTKRPASLWIFQFVIFFLVGAHKKRAGACAYHSFRALVNHTIVSAHNWAVCVR